MGKCIVHMQKVKKAGLRGIQSHMNREHDSKTNPDIDTSRSQENYHIIEETNLHQAVKDTIADYIYSPTAIRKDAVYLCCFVVTSDEATMKAMSKEQRENFFKDSVDFFARRYGREFIAYATVHNDETTPHLHIGIVPAAKCKDTDDYKLSAKDLFNPKELKKLQTYFYDSVGIKYGLERGQENSQAKHLSEVQYKLQKASEKLKAMEGQVQELQSKITALEARESELKEVLPELEVEVAEKHEELSALDKAIKRKDDEGVAAFGIVDWKERIQSIKEQDKKEQRLSLIEKFLELPGIKPLWEAFLHEMTKGRSKTKAKTQHEIGS